MAYSSNMTSEVNNMSNTSSNVTTTSYLAFQSKSTNRVNASYVASTTSKKLVYATKYYSPIIIPKVGKISNFHSIWFKSITNSFYGLDMWSTSITQPKTNLCDPWKPCHAYKHRVNMNQMCGGSIGATSIFARYHSGMISLGPTKTKVTSEQQTKWCAMDKVMKRLSIELTHDSQDSICIVHCNPQGKPCGGGRVHWQLEGMQWSWTWPLMTYESNLVKKWRQSKMLWIKDFEYLHHPLNYKCVKDQVAWMLKTRHKKLKKRIVRGENWLHNCPKAQ